MKNFKQKTSINIVAVLVILCCFLCAAVGVGNAWFTSKHEQGIHIVVQVGGLNMCLYQMIGANKEEVYNTKQNATEAIPRYIEISEAIAPDEDIDLELTLKNVDVGGGVCLRFRLEMFASDINGDKVVEIEIEEGDSVYYDETDSYYYYDDPINGNEFEYDEEFIMLTSFRIPYESFKNMQGGETVKLVLTIQCASPIAGF